MFKYYRHYFVIFIRALACFERATTCNHEVHDISSPSLATPMKHGGAALDPAFKRMYMRTSTAPGGSGWMSWVVRLGGSF
jgi:hypothetical protein